MSRPEHIAPPEVVRAAQRRCDSAHRLPPQYYNDDEAGKYTNNSRVQQIQAEMTERCLELLALPPSAEDPDRAEPSFLLDIGCGSGLSGEIIEEEGHVWAGVDISASMLGTSFRITRRFASLRYALRSGRMSS